MPMKLVRKAEPFASFAWSGQFVVRFPLEVLRIGTVISSTSLGLLRPLLWCALSCKGTVVAASLSFEEFFALKKECGLNHFGGIGGLKVFDQWAVIFGHTVGQELDLYRVWCASVFQ